MIYWLVDVVCVACPWTDRTLQPCSQPFDGVCPKCRTPLRSFRLIGVTGRRE